MPISLKEEVELKTCPSCQNHIHDDLMLCPHCGYGFKEGTSASKRTMMGIPGVNLPGSKENPDLLEVPPTRSTLFGIPLGEGAVPGQPGSLLEESTSSEDDGHTEVVSPQEAELMLNNNLRVAEQEGIRTTSMGGFPSLRSALADELGSTSPGMMDTSDPEEESRTEVASASFIATLRESSEFRTLNAEDPGKAKRHETLVGMSLKDLAALDKELGEEGQVPQSASRTLFSLPMVQASEASEPEALRTEIMTPGRELHQTFSGAPAPSLSELQEAELGAAPSDSETKKEALLERLRRGREKQAGGEVLDEGTGSPERSTLFGVPSMPPLADEAQTRKEGLHQEEANEAVPATGVLRRRQTSGPSTRVPAPHGPHTTLLGGPASEPDADSPSPFAPAFSDFDLLADLPVDEISTLSEFSELSESQVDKTSVLQERQGSDAFGSIPALEDDVDTTREQSLDDIRAHFGARDEDATVQQDINVLREHLSEELLRPDIVKASSQRPAQSTPPTPFGDSLPLVEHVEPLPVVEHVEPLSPPMAAAGPPPPAARPPGSPQTLTPSASLPAPHVPQRTAVSKDDSVVLARPAQESKIGRTFQVAFGLFAALALLGAPVFHALTSFSPWWVSAAAGGLGALALLGVVSPGRAGARAVLLLAAGGGALGLFVLSLRLFALEPGVLLVCVGGLCALAAAAFPKIAGSL